VPGCVRSLLTVWHLVVQPVEGLNCLYHLFLLAACGIFSSCYAAGGAGCVRILPTVMYVVVRAA
jgi:hypothetical protein